MPATVRDEDDLRYEGWRVAFASGASLFFSSFLVYTFPVFFKPLAAEFSWSREAISVAYGLMALTSALAAPVIGYVLDRSRVQYIVAPCMVGMGAAFASLGLLAPR